MRIYSNQINQSVVIEKSPFEHFEIVANQIVGVRTDFYHDVPEKGDVFCNIFLITYTAEPLFIGGNVSPRDGMIMRKDIFETRTLALEKP